MKFARYLENYFARLKNYFPGFLWAWFKRPPEFVRYVFFGCVNTVLTYLIYLVCLRFMTYRAAYTVTFVCGIFISYFFNAQFVYKKQLQIVKALQFGFVYLMQYFVGLGLLSILVEVVHLSELIAPVLLLFLIVPANYVLNRRILKGREASSPLP